MLIVGPDIEGIGLGTAQFAFRESLRTLETDRIDLCQLHHVDPAVPLPESVGALDQLRQEGKIAAIGSSNVTVAQLDEALAVAPIAAVQNRLSSASWPAGHRGCP
jgi:pyridoxine 4-dehydrogenase